MDNKHATRISTLGSRITSVISVSLVLVILGILGMGMETSRFVRDNIRINLGVVVKLSPSATDDDIARVGQAVGAVNGLASMDFLSADSILAQESRLMGEDLGELLDENPFGAEFDVKVLPEYANGDSLSAIASRLSLDFAVDDVVAQTSMVDSVNNVLRRASMVLIAIGAALLVISFVLINNTVSLAVYSRRFIIHTMKLVGATGGFIRRPFVWAGVVTGLVAAAVAIAVLSALRAYAATFDPIVAECLGWDVMALIFAAMLVAGVAICALASAMATNRYLRTSYDDMFF